MTVTRSATVTLPTDEQILITREFDAPKELVFKAWTTPELVRRWWHANRGEMTVCEIDLRPGGAWRYVMVANDGMEVGFHGVYREVVPSDRLVSTEIYEGLPEGVCEEDAATEQVEVRPAVHLTLDRLESGDVPFDRATAPAQSESGAYGVVVGK